MFDEAARRGLGEVSRLAVEDVDVLAMGRGPPEMADAPCGLGPPAQEPGHDPPRGAIGGADPPAEGEIGIGER